MNSGSIFAQMNGNWIRWSEYRIHDGYIMPAENALMMMYDAVAERKEMLCYALNCGRRLAAKESAEEVCLDFVSHYGVIGWLTALPADIDFQEHQVTYLRYAGYVSSEKMVATKDYIACFFPQGSELVQNSIAQLTNRDAVFNKVFSKFYGEPVAWTATMLLALYEHYCCGEEMAKPDLSEKMARDLKRRLELKESLGLSMHISFKSAMHCSYEMDSLRALLLFTYSQAQCPADKQPSPLKRCKRCGDIYYNENNRSEFCSTKCRNHYNVVVFRERHRSDNKKKVK